MASCGQRRTDEVDENENMRSQNQKNNQNDIEQHQHPPRGNNAGGSCCRRSSQNPTITRRTYTRALPSHNYYLALTDRPSPAEEERFRICIILIASWLFMAVAILFLLCYLYLLEWTPETADPIHVFQLELAVYFLYVMFVVDIFASIAIIVAHQDYAELFRKRIFWPAVVCLCLNHIHGTFIGFWVWTGEFPRTCSQNSFYLGRKCPNLANILITNTDGKLRLGDCKCDYGTCLPECKGLRLIQHYFWSTFWLYIVRTALIIICIPWLRRAVCQCKWCCCIDPRDQALVQPHSMGNRPNDCEGLGDPNDNYCPYDCCCPHHQRNVCNHSCHRDNPSQCTIRNYEEMSTNKKRASNLNDDAKALGFKESCISNEKVETRDQGTGPGPQKKIKPCKVSEGTDVQYSFYKCPSGSLPQSHT